MKRERHKTKLNTRYIFMKYENENYFDWLKRSEI
ncbi:hypothetical protein T01_13036 [Trichinella spiralis]|uniref:Uncharacterized protein n=1 Tax=Trichinella spiralis TaxID=6334 RepID=A0A0V1AIM8_TRISP|nr:hypothetical protein T01_13036 [Trichinella spiralis]